MMLATVPTLLLAALVSSSMAYYESPLLEALAVPSADHETTSYLLPRLSAKFRSHGDWESAPDPRFYVLTELERESNQVTAKTLRNTQSPWTHSCIAYTAVEFKQNGSYQHQFPCHVQLNIIWFMCEEGISYAYHDLLHCSKCRASHSSATSALASKG